MVIDADICSSTQLHTDDIETTTQCDGYKAPIVSTTYIHCSSLWYSQTAKSTPFCV